MQILCGATYNEPALIRIRLKPQLRLHSQQQILSTQGQEQLSIGTHGGDIRLWGTRGVRLNSLTAWSRTPLYSEYQRRCPGELFSLDLDFDNA